ncbi:hypothetical protein [Siminovitchia sp. 179-K 8D1 HS]|uniref:hypothetical protein n=1 Tax=Siminovitchia sp. 179-K 8D1 HS TaxID=3142385 RepID=UPI0039A22875
MTMKTKTISSLKNTNKKIFKKEEESMPNKVYKKVTKEFYDMLKALHNNIYNGKFVSFDYKNSREFIIRGYRQVTSEPVD